MIKYSLLTYHLNNMVELLMNKYHMSYELALSRAIASETYQSLVASDYLYEEGELFILELLEGELVSKVA